MDEMSKSDILPRTRALSRSSLRSSAHARPSHLALRSGVIDFSGLSLLRPKTTATDDVTPARGHSRPRTSACPVTFGADFVRSTFGGVTPGLRLSFPLPNPPGKRRPCEKPSCVASERTCAVRSVSLPSPTVWLRHQEFSPVRTFFIGAKREYMCVDRGKASSGRHKHRVA